MNGSTSSMPPTLAASTGAGRDLDMVRRPGVPKLHSSEPLPGTRYPPERQRAEVTVFMHGRRHKTFPPVFGTAVPPRGLSGLVRKAAYAWPDHAMRHWTLLLFADRVDLWEHRARRLLPWVATGVAFGLAALGAASRLRVRAGAARA